MATAKNPVIPTPEPTPAVTSEDAVADKMTEDYMRDYYAKQEKVTIRTQEDEWVQVNGYTFIIKKGERVSVPKDIAQILEDAGRI